MDKMLFSVNAHLAAVLLAALVAEWVTRQNRQKTEAIRDYEVKMASHSLKQEKQLDAFCALDASELQKYESKKLSKDEMLKLEQGRSAAFADISLFGDKRLMQLLDQSIQENTSFDTSILIKRLREFLKELYNLKPAEDCYQWLKNKLSPKIYEAVPSNYVDVNLKSQI